MINKHTIISAVIGGSIGSIMMLFAASDPFNLYYMNGYIIFLVFIFSLYISQAFYRRNAQAKRTYLQRVLVGLITYWIIIILTITISLLIGRQLLIPEQTTEFSKVIGIHLLFGLTLSLLLAIERKKTKVTTTHDTILPPGGTN